MDIIAVIPDNFGTASEITTSTQIIARDVDGKTYTYSYSHYYDLLRDGQNLPNWVGWNGGTLTEAIQWVMELTFCKKNEMSPEIC